MAEEVGSLYYDLNIDDKNLKSQLANADRHVKSFGDRVGKVWGGAVAASRKFMLGFVAAGAAATVFGVKAVKAYRESELIAAQTNAVLKSTGSIAGVTAQEVDKLAKSLQYSSLFTDEQVQTGQNLLLTFTKIGKNVFPQATQTMVDMSQALGQDMKSSAIQLGKALNDPIRGVTALRKVGVSFTEKQQEQIAVLVKSGKVLEAQKLILKELQVEFGGSAEAALRAAGPFAIMGKIWDDTTEIIGKFIAGGLDRLGNKLMDIYKAAGGAEGIFNRLREAFEKIKPWLPEIAGAITAILLPAVVSLVGATLLLFAKWAIMAAIGAGIVMLLKNLGINFSNIIPKLKELWQWFTNLPGALQLLISPIGFLITHFNTIKGLAMSLANIFMTWVWPSLKALASTIWSNLLPALKQLWDAVMRLWKALNPALMTAIKVIAAALGVLLIGAIWIVINVINVFVKALAFVASAISNVVKWISNLISWLGTAAVAVGRAVMSVINWFSRMQGYARDTVNAVASWFRQLPGRIRAALSGVGETIKAPFRGAFNWLQQQIDRIRGLFNTLKNAANSVINAPSNAAKGIKGLLGRLPGFAEGGIVPGPIGAPQLAVVHGGEEVIPNGGSGGRGNTFYIGQINNSQDEQYVLRRLNADWQLESMGASPSL